MKYFIKVTLLLLPLLIIISCENERSPVQPAIIPVTCDTLGLTYSSGYNSMQSIINVQCGVNNNSCHSPMGQSGYDYSTYTGIYTNYQNGLLYSALFGSYSKSSNAMPKVQQPGWNTCILAKFKAWIDLGCPQ